MAAIIEPESMLRGSSVGQLTGARTAKKKLLTRRTKEIALSQESRMRCDHTYGTKPIIPHVSHLDKKKRNNQHILTTK
jgi:hypothetical protein